MKEDFPQAENLLNKRNTSYFSCQEDIIVFSLKDAFDFHAPAWEKAVKNSLKIGFGIGLFAGLVILFKIL